MTARKLMNPSEREVSRAKRGSHLRAIIRLKVFHLSPTPFAINHGALTRIYHNYYYIVRQSALGVNLHFCSLASEKLYSNLSFSRPEPPLHPRLTPCVYAIISSFAQHSLRDFFVTRKPRIAGEWKSRSGSDEGGGTRTHHATMAQPLPHFLPFPSL